MSSVMSRLAVVFGVVVVLSMATSVCAGDEGLAREYVTVSGFRESLVNLMKSSKVPSTQMAALDLAGMESTYAKSIAKHLNNEEIKALIEALKIPGYKSAMSKMPLVSAEMMSASFKAAQDAADKLGAKSPQVPKKLP